MVPLGGGPGDAHGRGDFRSRLARALGKCGQHGCLGGRACPWAGSGRVAGKQRLPGALEPALGQAAWLVSVIPTSMGPMMAVITGLLSIPMTFFMSNDAFNFGVLPVLSETAAHFGIDPAAMARASIASQPVHMQSPLVPAILLLVSLSRVELGDHHKKTLWRALVVALVMLGVGIGVGAIPWG